MPKIRTEKKYTVMPKCEKRTEKKYTERPSPSYSANDCPDQTMKGNDGKMYKSIKTEKGYYVWKLNVSHKEKALIDISRIYQNIIIIRNNSIIVPKKRGRQTDIILEEDEGLLVRFSSKYVPSIDNKAVTIPISDLHYYNHQNGKKSYFKILFSYSKNDYFVEIILSYDVKNIDTINNIIKLIGKKKNVEENMTLDYLDKTLDHHYGNLALLTMKRAKQLKKGTKYYVVMGETWNEDFTGKYNIGVLDFQGINYKGETTGDKELIGTLYMLGDELDAINLWMNNYSMNYFAFGGSQLPVHLITKWQKGFKPPAKLPEAKLFNY